MTKASVAFVVSTDLDVHFKCCISADSKVKGSIEHDSEVKPIQACRVHSRALEELSSQRSTARWKTRGRGPGVWKTRDVENTGCGKHGVSVENTGSKCKTRGNHYVAQQ